jgi:ABC-type Fe3+ transport system permease subunit
MMSPTEKRNKRLVALLLAAFVLAEIPFSRAWVHEQGGIAGAYEDFWHHIFNSPVYQVTAIDLTGLATLTFLWMISDSRRRRHPWRAWLWLPVFLFSPSLGIFGYLLTRRGWELPPESA